MKVLFYVQHLLGIGHLARASLIARALVKSGARVKLVLGGNPVLGFPGPGMDVAQLPPVAAGPKGFAELVDAAGRPIDDTFRTARRDRLIELFNDFEPDVVLIEAFPFGRRQMRFELLPLLEVAVQRQPAPVIACSLRDILQQRAIKRHRETVEMCNRYFDAILVHGDAGLVTLEETFPLVAELRSKVVYTGIVSAPPGPLEGKSHDVIVSAGGGVVGGALMRCALQARPGSPYAADRWCFLVGPNFDADARQALEAGAGEGVVIEEARQDFRALLKAARLSISQAGYNTVADILQARCRALVVPFAQHGESEQSLRAGKLTALGAMAALSEQDLTPDSLLQSLRQVAKTDFQRPDIDLGGAAGTAQALLKLHSSA